MTDDDQGRAARQQREIQAQEASAMRYRFVCVAALCIDLWFFHVEQRMGIERIALGWVWPGGLLLILLDTARRFRDIERLRAARRELAR